jgi:hypothetical protein
MESEIYFYRSLKKRFILPFRTEREISAGVKLGKEREIPRCARNDKNGGVAFSAAPVRNFCCWFCYGCGFCDQ